MKNEQLNTAIIDAGGAPLLLSTLNKMTVVELIELLAPNGIRFSFDESKVLK